MDPRARAFATFSPAGQVRHHPTINAFKKLLLRTLAAQPLGMFVDLHGHSRKKNIFMYGCAERGSALLQQVRSPHQSLKRSI